ncbi:N,N-dimethylformamidase beta subunit family domain-containing protein [Streptomyces sp. NPDC088910]|uniref:N,N-dimethylformamidase beta subunit family domain-containing protein n=1 Tax=Streptomyces sp. NPDC088910 TaxID=3365911 RepID=UPI00380E5A8B
MDDEREHPAAKGPAPQPGAQGPPPGPYARPADDGAPPGPARRRVLHAAVAGVVGAAAAGCDSGSAAVRRTPTSGPTPVRRAGTDDWRIRSLGPPDAIEGYADRVSVRPGERVGLYVSTTAPGFRVAAYRVGWYGGSQATRVWTSPRTAGHRQPGPRTSGSTRTVTAGWERGLDVPTDGWPEGAYLLLLTSDDGHQRYVPLVVRSAVATGRTLIMHAPATWQAYNDWGGYSLYNGRDGGYGDRSLAVSFDRPYAKNGAEKFLVYERALVVLAERLGLPLAYTTGIDVHRDPGVLRGATTAVALGHDEYWTPEQRAHVTAARDAGTNLVFLGANTCFRRIRLEAVRGGEPRTVVCYKTDYQSDPGLARDPAKPTNDFRARPAPDPESSLTGVIYEGYPTDAPYVVESADHWLFAGTGAARGDRFAHLVGVEYDRVDPGCPTPAPIEVVAHSPLVCDGRASHSDSAYYTVPGGAGVFATGTMRWVEGLMAGTGLMGRDHGMDERTRTFVTKVTENLLTGFAAGRAAASRPAPRANVSRLYGT